MNNLFSLLLIVASVYLSSPFCIFRGQQKTFKASLCCENRVSSEMFFHFGPNLTSLLKQKKMVWVSWKGTTLRQDQLCCFSFAPHGWCIALCFLWLFLFFICLLCHFTANYRQRSGRESIQYFCCCTLPVGKPHESTLLLHTRLAWWWRVSHQNERFYSIMLHALGI